MPISLECPETGDLLIHGFGFYHETYDKRDHGGPMGSRTMSVRLKRYPLVGTALVSMPTSTLLRPVSNPPRKRQPP
jgi:hypothetical protein